MGTITTLLKIKADASGAVSGLKPLQHSLDQTAQDAQTTEKALSDLGKDHKVTLNDKAIATARQEIERLRSEMRKGLSINPQADTKGAQRRIAELQKSIKVLDNSHPVVDAKVTVDATSTSRMESLTSGIQNLDETSGGSIPGISLAAASVSKLGGAAGAAAPPLAALTFIVGGWRKAWDLTRMAADIETVTAQLDALTNGHGVETIQELQKEAAATPFGFSDLADATGQLLAAGVALKDIPGYLKDIGNIASVSNKPIGQIASIFSQMESSQKATFENIQQLADNSIPSWQALADATGKTVPELQKLATEGKLDLSTVTLLHQQLSNLYPDAMLNQSKTLNGELSTLHDNVTQTGQALGTLFLPMMKDVTEGMLWFTNNVLEGAQAIAALNATVRGDNKFGIDLFGAINPVAGTVELIHHFTKGTDDAGKSMKGLKDDTTDALKAVMDGLDASTQSAADFEKALKAAEDNVRATIEDFGNIGVNVRTHVSFLIDSANLEEEIHKAIKGTPGTKTEKGEPSVTLPAHLTIAQIPDLSAKQKDLFGNLDSFVEAQLQEGARRAELNPNFNEDAWFRQVRQKTKGLLIDAGIDPDNAERVLRRIFGLPRTVPVNADISHAQAELDAFTPKPIKLPLVLSPQKLDKKDPLMQSFTGGALAPVTAPVVPSVPPADVSAANSTLRAIAAPEKPRVAHIVPAVDVFAAAAVRRTLNALAKDRISTIYVHTVFTAPRNTSGGTAPGGGVRRLAPAAPDGLLAGARAVTASTETAAAAPWFSPVSSRTAAVAAPAAAPAPTHLAPRQTPVQVILDGDVIADRLQLRRSLAAVESVRRTA